MTLKMMSGYEQVAVDKFYRDSVVLTISNLVTGIIGFIFSIVLSRALGAEGLGLYGLVMPVYGLLLCLTSEGLVTAISKISAVYYNKKDFRNLQKTLGTVFICVTVWAVGVALVTFFNSSVVSRYLIRDARASDAVMILCPALVFVPLSAVIKGYFYGLGRFKTAAYVDIVEKILRVLILTGTTAVLTVRDVKSMVTTAYMALAAGELVSLTILYILYRTSRNKIRATGGKAKSRVQLLFDVLVISSPLCLNGFLSSIISTASALILPRRLMHAGFQYSEALSTIGRFSGMALNIVYLPFIIIGSMLTVLIPDLSLSLSRKDLWAVEERISQVLKVSILVGIATLTITLSIPDLLGQVLYGRTDLGEFIKFASVTGFSAYVSSPTFGILNALGKQNILLRNSILTSLEGLLLIYFLTGVPSLNIYGYGICIAVTSITAFIANIIEIGKICEVRLKLTEIGTYILMGMLVFLIVHLSTRLLPQTIPILKTALTVLTGYAAMFGLTRAVGALGR